MKKDLSPVNYRNISIFLSIIIGFILVSSIFTLNQNTQENIPTAIQQQQPVVEIALKPIFSTYYYEFDDIKSSAVDAVLYNKNLEIILEEKRNQLNGKVQFDYIFTNGRGNYRVVFKTNKTYVRIYDFTPRLEISNNINVDTSSIFGNINVSINQTINLDRAVEYNIDPVSLDVYPRTDFYSHDGSNRTSYFYTNQSSLSFYVSNMYENRYLKEPYFYLETNGSFLVDSVFFGSSSLIEVRNIREIQIDRLYSSSLVRINKNSAELSYLKICLDDLYTEKYKRDLYFMYHIVDNGIDKQCITTEFGVV